MNYDRGNIIMENISEDYIKLAFAVDNLLGKGSVVDAYYGDSSFSSPLPNLTSDELITELEELRTRLLADVSDTALNIRKLFLEKQLLSLATLIRLRTRSLTLSYSDCIKLLLDTELIPASKIKVENRLHNLTRLLHQLSLKGDLREMVNNWERSGTTEIDRYVYALEEAMPKYLLETSNKVVRPILGSEFTEWLLKQNSLIFEVKETNESWSAYNYYEKGFKGHIVFNKTAELNIFNIPIFITHEAYPGHHTNALVRESLYSIGKLGPEATLHLLCTPESLISEGIAEYGYHLLNNQNKDDINLSIAIELDRLRTETQYLAAIQLYVREDPEDKVKQFMAEKGLMMQERLERSFRFLQEWKYYVPSYVLGFALVKSSIERYGIESMRMLYELCNVTILGLYAKIKGHHF